MRPARHPRHRPADIGEIARAAATSPEPLRDRILADRRERLARFVDEAGPAERPVPTEVVVVWGRPFEEILRRARDFAVDMIVLGVARHSTDLESFLFGSTAEKVNPGRPMPRSLRAGVAMSWPAAILVAIFVTRAAPPPVTAPDPTAMPSRVRALLTEGRWVEALDEARRSVRETPESPDLRAALGEALYRAGRIAEAGGPPSRG